MERQLTAAAATDTGRSRERNEDAMIAGDAVFAVADGMGGHLAGDVAAATALLPVESLDGKVFADAPSARAALLDAILAANAAVVRKAADDPDLRGMGTTLTATIVEGRRLHVGHVGDSRAYLVRDGELTQLTRDHTLVAHLIEKGQITEEEAATHPHRSIVTRAIGVDVDIEVDTLTIDLADGDEILICSDGLTGPLSDDEILETLMEHDDIDEAAQALIDLANEHGGPDNITVVLLRYETDEPRPHSEGQQAPAVIRPDRDRGQGGGDWAEAMGRLGSLGRQDDRSSGTPPDDDPGGGPAWQRLLLVLLVVIGLVAVAFQGGQWLLSRSYYVGIADSEVAIFQGVPGSVGPIELSWVAERTGVETEEIAPWYQRNLREGVPAADLTDARRIVTNAPRREDTQPGSSDPATEDEAGEAEDG